MTFKPQNMDFRMYRSLRPDVRMLGLLIRQSHLTAKTHPSIRVRFMSGKRKQDQIQKCRVLRSCEKVRQLTDADYTLNRNQWIKSVLLQHV